MDKRKNIVAFALGIVLGRYGLPVLWHIIYISLIVVFAFGSCETTQQVIDKQLTESCEQ